MKIIAKLFVALVPALLLAFSLYIPVIVYGQEEPECELHIDMQELYDELTGTTDVLFSFSGGTGALSCTGDIEGNFEQGETFIVTVTTAVELTIVMSDEADCTESFSFAVLGSELSANCRDVVSVRNI
ncbi:hypothetical protein N8482_03485, partial [Chitinophagales bacterium]|nr:hypothetical protein [Chitinophagales bacterium]